MNRKIYLRMICALLSSLGATFGATLTVTNSADSGPGTLRQSIEDANADASPDLVTIAFSIPGAGVRTLAPLTALPVLTRRVTIDGYTQPGASLNTRTLGSDAVLLIELVGTNLPGSSGLYLADGASHSVVRGLVINRWAYGIGLAASDSILEGNYMGTDATGTNAQPNDIGLAISGTGNRIGGLTPGARNVISGNTGGRGIWLTVGTSNLIVGNYVGLGADGMTPLPNAAGIYISGLATGNQVGGTAPNARNVISANAEGCYDDSVGGNAFLGNFIGTDASGTLNRGNAVGITLATTGSVIGGTNAGAGNLLSGRNGTAVILGSSNVVAGNLIGTDVTGRMGLGNEYDGVLVFGSGNVIGGTAPAARNVIAANRYGIFFFQPTANNNRVLGNYIGTDITGTNGLGNAGGIVSLYGPLNVIGGPTAAEGNVISANTNGAIEFIEGASNSIVQGNLIGMDVTGTVTLPNGRGIGANTPGNLIGGTNSGEGNVISGNTGVGVAVGETNNAMLGNRISGNGALGIDLFGDGLTPNDAGDGDAGPNHYQNSPEISSAALAGGDLTLRYQVDSTAANAAYPLTVEFFLADSAASGEGSRLIHRHTYTTPQTFTNITLTPGAPVSDGDPLVATATDANGNTSEFSAVATASANQAPVVANPISDQQGTSGSPFAFTFAADTFADPDPTDILNYTVSGQPPGVTFDGPTRTFGGTPTTSGLFNITVTATDNGLLPLSASDAFELTVVRASFLVTNLADSGAGTLRQAIADALPGDTIEFAVTGTIALEGALHVDKALSIEGPGPTNLVIRGLYGSRIFNLTTGPTKLSGVTLTAGYTANFFVVDPEGGAIRNTAHLTLDTCTLVGNASHNQGGAVMNLGPAATCVAVNCTFADNVALSGFVFFDGGGGAIWSDGTLRITNCTFSGNAAPRYGGAIYNSGHAVIASSTITRNRTDHFEGGAGGLYHAGGTLMLVNSIVAANTNYGEGLDAQDVGGVLTSGDYNLIGYTNNLVVPGTHNVLGLDPLLSPLRDNGGATLTHGLASTSPALDAADGAACLSVDQRGVVRPQAGGFDIGAFEGALPLNHPPLVAIPIPDQHAVYGESFHFTVPAGTWSDPDLGQTLTWSSSSPLPCCVSIFNPASRTFDGPLFQVGRFTVALTVTDDGAPSLSASTTFDIVVSKRPVTARAEDQGRPYGRPNPPLSITYFGLVSDPIYLTNPPVATTVATPASQPGAYPIVLSAGADDHYDFVGLTNGTLTIRNFALDFEVVRSFGFTNRFGFQPQGSLVDGQDGNLYGFTTRGGALGDNGVVYSISKAGSNYTVLHHFQGYEQDGTPSDLIHGSDGALYGTAQYAGTNAAGIVFGLQTNGTGFTILHRFTGTDGDGSGPVVLFEGSDGALYGATEAGGIALPNFAAAGTLFRINRNGTGYERLHALAQFTDGARPSSLLEGSDGYLYGTAKYGGLAGGTLFRVSRQGAGFTNLHDFAAASLFDTESPHSLMEASDGLLYGLSYFSGITPTASVFKIGRDGQGFTNIHTFTPTYFGGANSLIEGSDGHLYGAGKFDFTDGYGVIFRLSRDGSTYTRIWGFNGANGDFPLGLVEASGVLYGGCSLGGPGSFGEGTLFRINLDGTGFGGLWNFTSSGGDAIRPSTALVEGSNGKLYGGTAAGPAFSLSKSGSNPTVLRMGANVALIESADGAVYGMDQDQFITDSNYLSRAWLDGSGATNFFHLPAALAGEYLTSLNEGSDGALYGSASSGGAFFGGTLFKVGKDGSGFVVIHDFEVNPFSFVNPPYAPAYVFEGSDGHLFGICYSGGGSPDAPYNFGSVFRVNRDGTGYTNIHVFDDTNTFVSVPVGRLIEASDGRLYGTAGGAVFGLNRDGSGYRVLLRLPTQDHLSPSGVTEGSDGFLYGFGTGYDPAPFGPIIPGGVYRLSKDGTDYCVLYRFGTAAGEANFPVGWPLQGSDGALYGAATRGGAHGFGAVFRIAVRSLNQAPTLEVPIADQSVAYGSPFTFSFPAGTFGDLDLGQTLSYSASGLPPGLVFDGPTRTVSGTPMASGTFSVTIAATDNGTPALGTNDVFNVVVAKASLVVSADNRSRLPGQANPPFTGTLVGVTNSDNITVSFVTAATPASPPGAYPITPVFSDPTTRLSHYSVTTNLGTLTVFNCATLSITNAVLANASRGLPYSVTLRASNGSSPYSFAVTGGSLPGNLTLAAGGLLSGTATAVGNYSFTVTATDAVGCMVSSNYPLAVVCPTLALSPASLPGALKDAAYSATFTTANGAAPYTYTVTGGVLPGGLTLASGGLLAGAATNAGSYSFTIRSTDAAGCAVSSSYAMTVEAPVYEGFAYAENAALNGQNGGTGLSNVWSGPNSFLITPGSFGTGPVSGGHLQPGEGTITRRLSEPIGTPGTTRYLCIDIRIVFFPSFGPPDRFGVLLNGAAGTGLFVGKPGSGNGNWFLENAAGGGAVAGPSQGQFGGKLVVKCEFFSGNDRFTLYVNPVPGQPEPASGTVKFNSDAGILTNIAFTVVNNGIGLANFDELRLVSSWAAAVPSCPAITVNPVSLPDGLPGTPYSQSLTASGGTAPHTFAVTGGALPNGLTLSSGGLLSGTPSSGGSFTVSAFDTIGCSGTRSYTVTVPCPTIVLSPGSLPSGTRGFAYSQVLNASGGTAPYTFGVTGGALPGGLSLANGGMLSGTPTTAGSFSFTITATDAVGCARPTNHFIEVGLVAPLSAARSQHTATLLSDGKVLVVGGSVSGTSIPLSTVELYDPTTGTWTNTGPLLDARREHTATLLANGKVLVTAGWGAAAGFLASAEIYDPATGIWTATAALNTGRYHHTATLLRSGKVLVAGGYCGCSNDDIFSELYDPIAQTWTKAAPINARRWYHTATLLPDGKVLIAGGYDSGSFFALASAEVFDPTGTFGNWTTAGVMAAKRATHTATLLPTGKVLVAAGAYDNFGGHLFTPAELYDPVSRSWATTGAPITARNQHTATLQPDGKVLVAGGSQGGFLFASADLYDAVTGTWTTSADLGRARHDHTATVLSSGRVLVVGGQASSGPLASAELRDPAVASWVATGALTPGRYGPSATVLTNGKVLLAGGTDFSGAISNANLYEPVTGAWTPTTSLRTGRWIHTANLLPDGRVLVAGGLDFSFNYLASVELYNPAAGTWTVGNPFTTGRIGHTSTLLANGKVLLVGGRNSLGVYLPSSQLYDPATGAWMATGDLKTGRRNHSATLLSSGKVLVTGGISDGDSPAASAELYDPQAGAWADTGPLNTGRYNHTATLLPDGTVLIAGGYAGVLGSLAGAELFDPTTGTWRTTGGMTDARYFHTATLLHSGKVLVAGGFGLSDYLASAELYDPVAHAWTATPALAAARQSHTATLLANGRVLVAGGVGTGPSHPTGVQLYDAGLGFSAAWQPQIATVASPLTLGGSVTLTGSRFRGLAEGSSGGTQDSPADHPVVQLRSIESGQTLFLRSTNWSTNSFSSEAVTHFPSGWTLVTLFVNGIPSTSSILRIDAGAVPTAMLLANPLKLPNGSFRFSFANAPGAAFTALATTNVALPMGNWTVLGPVTEIAPGQFQFTDAQAATFGRRYYGLRTP